MAKRFLRPALFALLLAVNPHVSQGQSPRPALSGTQDDQRLRDAQTAKEEAETEYYREQVAKLREPSRPKTFWQNIEDNPASALGVLGAIIAALVGLFSLYKNQRLTIETQNDAQFYEALKRFGDKDSARLRSSAVGLLTDMASRNIVNHPVRPFHRDTKVASRYFTVLNQLVAASRSPAMWRPLEQVTGFNSYLLYDWFGHITHNFQENDESSLAEVDNMTADEKVRHKQRASWRQS